jgi:HicA-like toxin of HicAB toxin-antitoxin system
MRMNTKQRKTMKLIFKVPVPSDVRWPDIEALLEGFGAKIQEGNGSRVRVVLNGVRAVFHRPHPQNITDKGALVSVRKFLINAGIPHDAI